MVCLLRLKLFGHLRQGSRFQYVDDKDGVVRRQASSALGDDVRMRNTVLVGCIHECIDAVVDIFLNAVIHGTLAVGRAGTVVVDPQTASAVDEIDAVPHPAQVHVILCCLVEGGLDAAYLGNLRSDVEVNEVQAVVQPLLVERLQRLEQLRRSESELGGIAAALGPFSRPAGCQFDADAEVRLHIQLLRCPGNEVYFVELLHHDEDALAHLLRQQSQFDVALILVTVADDERVALALYGDDCVQLGLRPGLQSQIELASVGDDFLHHRLHLIHLNRIDDEVLGLESVLLSCLLEAGRSLLDTVVKNVGETEQHRRRDITQGELVHDIAQVYLRVVLTGRDIHVTLAVYAEVRCAPSRDVVQFLRIFNRPLFHFRSSVCL